MIDKRKFHSYSLWTVLNRGYQVSWAYTIFREYFGERIDKEIVKTVRASEPTDEYRKWLADFFQGRKEVLLKEVAGKVEAVKDMPKYIQTERGKEKLCLKCGDYSPATCQYFFARPNLKLEACCKKCSIKERKAFGSRRTGWTRNKMPDGDSVWQHRSNYQ